MTKEDKDTVFGVAGMAVFFAPYALLLAPLVPVILPSVLGVGAAIGLGYLAGVKVAPKGGRDHHGREVRGLRRLSLDGDKKRWHLTGTHGETTRR